MNFGPSAKRLLRRLRPHRMQVGGVILLAIGSVALSVLGPKILGRATDIIFAGAIGKQLPGGLSKEQVIEQTRAAGNGRLADLLGGIDLIPGVGIDFDALRNVLMLVLALYVGVVLPVLDAGLHPERRRAADGLRAAVRGRGQAEPAAAELLRRRAAR